MPRVGMHYNYNDFLEELDEEINEAIVEREEQLHQRGLKKKNKIQENIKKKIKNEKFIDNEDVKRSP